MVGENLTDIDFEAIFDLEQARLAAKDDRLAFGRRVTLLALTRDKAELVESVRKVGTVPFCAWLDQIEEFQKELRYLLELAGTAHTRLLIAGQVVIEQAPKH